MALVVGLTGGIASGKTTISNLFQSEYNIDVVDADIIARQVVETGSEGLKAIIEHFGEEILSPNKALDRVKLRALIFQYPEKKLWLDNLMHPLIRSEMQRQIAQVKSEYALLVIPLMAENNLQSLVDKVIVVDVDEEIQIERTLLRDKVSTEQVKAIIKSQANRQERLAIADYVIKNNTRNHKILPQIAELHQIFMEICKKDRQK
ncbi:dephospho-CoA kinase [Vibrio caribbeanicus]|uniref:Dephospho-CoA kinase n=1 Tax=Vibrio caribbeanicus ATCC BAA-2122 TaxID=796620 RepID=E3BM17_9VIBR|nr:dephospho-CoA kinase [Vibrio caribbeanicus]EFP95945.1 dephospho-CoA kinase [Vibrio caribbeanicus ATCC BAA-2122]